MINNEIWVFDLFNLQITRNHSKIFKISFLFQRISKIARFYREGMRGNFKKVENKIPKKNNSPNNANRNTYGPNNPQVPPNFGYPTVEFSPVRNTVSPPTLNSPVYHDPQRPVNQALYIPANQQQIPSPGYQSPERVPAPVNKPVNSPGKNAIPQLYPDPWADSCLGFNPWTAQSWIVSQPNRVPQNLYPTINMPNVQNQSISMSMINYPTVDFSVEQFQELRQHSTVREALGQLNELATDIRSLRRGTLNFKIPRACFICCNTYQGEEKCLGVGPINDSITVAANHKCMGYVTYYLHDAKSDEFLEYLQIFLQNSTDYLTVFYTGHGAAIDNLNGTERSGFDEAMIFVDTYIIDDDLAKMLLKYANGITRVILMSDCCHSGTIWDIPEDPIVALTFPANIISISASNDEQTAKQATIKNTTQGLFTFYFWKILREDPALSIRKLAQLVTKQIFKFKQEVCYHPTRFELIDVQLFPIA